MSEFLRAAKDKLRSAVQDLDAELAALETRQTELQAYRTQVLAVIDGEADDVRPPTKASTRIARTHAPANRIVAFLQRKGSPATAQEVWAVSHLKDARYLVKQLVAAKRVVMTGRARGTRYTLPAAGTEED